MPNNLTKLAVKLKDNLQIISHESSPSSSGLSLVYIHPERPRKLPSQLLSPGAFCASLRLLEYPDFYE
jgi:hypothetical protein